MKTTCAMKRSLLTVGLLGWLGGLAPVAAQRAADFSAALQALIPDEEIVRVHFTDGRSERGVILEETREAVKFRLERGGGVSYEMEFPRARIERVERTPPANYVAVGLLRLNLNPQAALEEKDYLLAMEAFEEFLRLAPNHGAASPLRERRSAFAAELAKLRAGHVKRAGVWRSPVEAALADYAALEAQLADARTRFRGIENPDYRDNPRAKAYYDELAQEQRLQARRLPELISGRIPQLLQRNGITEAAEEIDGFRRFYLEHIFEARQTNVLTQAFVAVPLDAIQALERQVVAAADRQPPPPALARADVPADMVYVPGGYFLMGGPGTDAAADHFPLRLVYVAPFLLDKHETTNAEYREFIEAVREGGAAQWAHSEAPPLKSHEPKGWGDPALSHDRQPVVGLDWFDAYAYTRWRGKRLPTEAEWEMAARGGDARPYPWGSGEPAGRIISAAAGRGQVATEIARLNPNVPRAELPAVPWEVDSALPKQAEEYRPFFRNLSDIESPGGALHLVGNAAEWVADGYDPQFLRTAPLRDPRGPEHMPRVFRGGSYLSREAEELKTYRRGVGRDRAREGLAEDGRPMIGVRGARSLPVAQ